MYTASEIICQNLEQVQRGRCKVSKQPIMGCNKDKHGSVRLETLCKWIGQFK